MKFHIVITTLILFLFTKLVLHSQCSTALKFSTFQGGNGEDQVVDLFVHPTSKYIYTIARTSSTNLNPTNGELGLGGTIKSYIQCMNNNGTLRWSTLISGLENPIRIFADNLGNPVIVAETQHGNLPMLGPGADKIFSGQSDIVYLKLNSVGNSVIGSSFIGGNGSEYISLGAGDNIKNNFYFFNNNIYGLSATSSTNIQPSTNALSNIQGNSYIFVYNILSETFQYQSYFPYSGKDAITVSNNGNIFLALTNKGSSSVMTQNYITQNAVISNYPTTPHNFPPIIIILNSNFTKIYGTYLSPFNLSSYIANGTPYVNFMGENKDIEVDENENIYYFEAFRFKEPNFSEYGNFSNFINLQNGTNRLIKLSKNSTNNYSLNYLHFLNCADDVNNVFYVTSEIEIDKLNRVHLTCHNAYNSIEQSTNYSRGFSENISQVRYSIYKANSNLLEYNTYFNFDIGREPEGLLNGIFIDNTDFYVFGINRSLSFPTTPSWRDHRNNTQTIIQQPDFGGGNTDGFITAFHTPVPNVQTIPDFPPNANTFCRNSFISNNGQLLGTPTTNYISGDGSSDLHIVPNVRFGSQTIAHPVPRLRYQWQRSTNNSTWVNIVGAIQEQYQPANEPNAGNVYYRRNLLDCCGNVWPGNSVLAMINTTVNNMTVSFGTTPYKHCPGTATTLTSTVAGGSNNISWKWYNGYEATNDINPATGTGAMISAQVKATTTQGGVYRVVVKNNVTGCETEALVTVVVARVDMPDTISLCPGTTGCISIGPEFYDPNYSFSWSGPNNYSSTMIKPCVQNVGRYILTLNNCPTTKDTIVIIQTPHHSNLTTIQNYTFCQYGRDSIIGMNTQAPPGYLFQWAPTRNIIDITQFKPTYRPFDLLDNNSQVYRFSAKRNSDGCVYETTTTIGVTPGAEILGAPNSLLCDGEDVLNARITAVHYRWTIIATTFSTGVNGLVNNASFRLNNLNIGTATTLAPTMRYPLATTPAGYTITFRIEASYLPLGTSNMCTKVYDQIFYVRPCSIGSSCPQGLITSNKNSGIFDGICGSSNTILDANTPLGSSVTWTIDQVDPPATSTVPLFGLFDLNSVQLPVNGPHINAVIANLDVSNPAQYRSVRYRATYNNSNGTSCFDTVRVYSKLLNTPIVDLKPSTLACNVLGGTLTSGKSLPITLDGSNHNNTSPNTTILWSWTSLGGQPSDISGQSPYPTINAGGQYEAKGIDRLSGCFAVDTIKVDVTNINGSAGDDITNVCKNTTIQLRAGESSDDFTYLWTPPVGLNFPLGTANNMVPRPFASINVDQLYTLKTKTGSCETTDQLQIRVSTTAPPAIVAKTIDVCVGIPVTLESNADINCNGCTFTWSVVSGGQLSWLSSVNSAEPFIMVPAGTSISTAVFRLQSSKGDCGMSSGLFTINIRSTPPPALPEAIQVGCTLPLSPLTVSNHQSGTTYNWSFTQNGSTPVLYQNNNMTNPFTGGNTSLTTLFPFTTSEQTYSVTAQRNGCLSKPVDITVVNNLDLIAEGGSELSLCSPGNTGLIGTSTPYPTGAIITWTAVGFSINPLANNFSPPFSSAQKSQIESWLSSTSTASATVTRPTGLSNIGSYRYKITVRVGSCISEDFVVVRFVNVAFPQINFAANPVACDNQCYFLLGSASPSTSFQYQWSASPYSETQNMTFPNSPNPLVCPKTNVTYSLIMTDAATGCKSSTQSITYNIFPGPKIDDKFFIEVCNPGSTINLTSYIPNYSSYPTTVWTKLPNGGIITNPTNYVVNGTTDIELRVSNQFGCNDVSVLHISDPDDIENNDDFYFLTGHQDKNIATKIKFIDGHVFLSYLQFKGSDYFAGMAKYKRDGTVVWNKLLNYPSRINDFIEDENCNILAVGHKGLFNNTTDNTSLIITFDSGNGNQIYGKEQLSLGREEYIKVIKNNSNTNNKYYFSHTKNIGTIGSTDIPGLVRYSYNTLNNGAFEYNNGSNDLESHRGMIQLSTGSILMIGNEGNTGRGSIKIINPTTGAVSAKVTDLQIDFYDAIETVEGNIILIGDKFDTKDGVILVLSDRFDLISYYSYPKVNGFRQIKLTENNEYLILCSLKQNNPKLVLFSFNLNFGLITNNLGYYIDDVDTELQSYWFDYDPVNKKVAYIDTRRASTTGFGDLDMFLGIFDKNLSLECTKSIVMSSDRRSIKLTNENYSSKAFNLSETNISGLGNNDYKISDVICDCKNDKEKPIVSSAFSVLELPIASSKNAKVNWSNFRFTILDECSKTFKLDTLSKTYDCSHVGQTIFTVIRITDASNNITEYTVGVKVTDPDNYCNTTVCNHPDYIALRDFYNSTNGPLWTNTVAGDKPWLVDCDPCGLIDGTPWKGIECDNMGRVDRIFLNNNNLAGTLPASIGQLTKLEWFSVHNNKLTGSLPLQICSLNRMLHFVVSKNMFSGTFPPCIANLPALARIVANDNKFTGSLPILGGVTQPGLINLHFDNNMFTGGIPSQYANLPGLTYLAVSNNQLSGCYPQVLSTFCTNPNFTSNSNALVSDGNGFSASWTQFCSTGAGSCTVSTSDQDVYNFYVYPNPVSDHIYINFQGDKSKLNIIVYDNTGRIFKDKSSEVENGVLSLDVSLIPAGIYFLKVGVANYSKFTKFIKID